MPSEGEHKITRHLKANIPDVAKTNSSGEEKEKEYVCVYSNDGDMAFLALQFPKKSILTMIDSNFLPTAVKKQTPHNYVYFDNEEFQKVFIQDLLYEPPQRQYNKTTPSTSTQATTPQVTQQSPTSTPQQSSTLQVTPTTQIPTPQVNEVVNEVVKEVVNEIVDAVNVVDVVDEVVDEIIDVVELEGEVEIKEKECPPEWDPDRILLDFVCVCFLGGNDFVRPIPFGEIRRSGSYLMYLSAYRKAKKRNFTSYLVGIENGNYVLNKKMFGDVIFNLARLETRKMKEYQDYIQHLYNKAPEWGPFDKWEDEWLEYQHTTYCQPGHPEHELVREEMSKYTYDQSELFKRDNALKTQYYIKNFNLRPPPLGDIQAYNSERSLICRSYVKSILFTLQYYLNGTPPSWRWTYPYHVAPFASDILIALRFMDFNLLGTFVLGEPYKALEQLLLTVPVQSGAFPPEYKVLSGMLPNGIVRMDRMNGEKYIYSEPILTPINEPKILQEAQSISLGTNSARRNQLGTTEYTHTNNNYHPNNKKAKVTI
jgi:5'-3' exonuclease